MRQAAVAGQFYPATSESLKDAIKHSFLDQRGPHQLPTIPNQTIDVQGYVVPHAGYIYSGPIAAHAYYQLASKGFADVFIILGPNHTGQGTAISMMNQGSWQTPLGTAPIHESLATKLHTSIIDVDNQAHLYEHSIEVQLPFLQYLSSSFSFVPICMAMHDIDTIIEVGTIIGQTIQEIGERVCVIASSDFSHVGAQFMDTPPRGVSSAEYAKQQDEKALHHILNIEPEELVQTVESQKITMCGFAPVASMLVALKILGANSAQLLSYGSSCDVHPGETCVGYGSVMIVKEG